MRVMVLMKASKQSEAGVMPSQQLFEEMGRFNEELVNAGIMLSGEGIHPSSRGARVRFSASGAPTVVRGPFANTTELVSGFWMWEVKSLDEAIEWVKRVPNTDGAHHEIEIRQVLTAEDFGDAMSPELRQQEAELRARAEGKR